MKSRHAWVAIGAVLATLVIGCSARAPRPAGGQAPAGFTFALIGDLGYYPDEERGLTDLLDDLNRNASLAFVVHVGDLASRRYACTDELLDRRLGQFRALAHPLVRVETFGSPYHHWIHVTVEPDDPNVFTFRPRLVATNLAPGR